MTTPTLTTPPTAPAIGDDATTFNTRAFALVAWLATMVSEMTTALGFVSTQATAAETAKDDAELAASNALASANFQGAYDAGTAYTVGQSVLSDDLFWACIQAGTGQAPAEGSAYWVLMPGQSELIDYIAVHSGII